MTTLVHDNTDVLALNEYADVNRTVELDNESTHEIWIESGSYGD